MKQIKNEKRLILILIAAFFIFSTFFLLGKKVDIETAFADIMSRESFLAMTPYGVAEAHDTGTTLRKAPAIYWGQDSDGSITFADGTYQYEYNASCEPTVLISPIIIQDTATTGYEIHIKDVTYQTCQYEVRRNANGTVTDVTSSVGVYWVSLGWR